MVLPHVADGDSTREQFICSDPLSHPGEVEEVVPVLVRRAEVTRTKPPRHERLEGGRDDLPLADVLEAYADLRVALLGPDHDRGVDLHPCSQIRRATVMSIDPGGREPARIVRPVPEPDRRRGLAVLGVAGGVSLVEAGEDDVGTGQVLRVPLEDLLVHDRALLGRHLLECGGDERRHAREDDVVDAVLEHHDRGRTDAPSTAAPRGLEIPPIHDLAEGLEPLIVPHVDQVLTRERLVGWHVEEHGVAALRARLLVDRLILVAENVHVTVLGVGRLPHVDLRLAEVGRAHGHTHRTAP